MNNRVSRAVNSIFHQEAVSQFALDVDHGLASCPKRIPSHYFYDKKGSELFKQITKLPEYYLTNCEQDILGRQAEQIVEVAAKNPLCGINLVELGAGDTEKPFPLIAQILKRNINLEYTAIDISETALNELSGRVYGRFPGIAFRAVNAEYFEALNSLEKNDKNRNFVLFLGSNIGNFVYGHKIDFLRKINGKLNSGDMLLIGFDLKKDRSILMLAYDDALGVTRQFNLNLLERINRELGGNFNVENFSHKARYNPVAGAMESYLVNHGAGKVFIEYTGRSYEFMDQETIHTESSHKYDLNGIGDLAAVSGFSIVQNFFDSKKYFVCSLWRK